MIYLNGEKITFETPMVSDPMSPYTDYGMLDKKLLTDRVNIVEVVFDGSQDFWKLTEIKTYLDSKRVTAALQMHYFPYAHNTTAIRDNARLEAHTAIRHINSLQFAGVRIMDPQRLDIVAAINRLTIHQFVAPHLQYVIEKVNLRHDIDAIVFPSHETANQFRILPFGAKFTHLISVSGNDYVTGKAKEWTWQFDEHPKPTAKALIISDLCNTCDDYRGLLVDLAHDFNIHETYLFTAHLSPNAICSIDRSTLKHVFASDSTTLKTSGKTTIMKA